MSIFLNKHNCLNATIIIFTAILLASLFFSALYYFIPLKIAILPVFANFSLGLAVFLGSFYLSQKTPFFSFSNIIEIVMTVIVIFSLCSLVFSELTSDLFIHKSILICAAATIGEIFGKL